MNSCMQFVRRSFQGPDWLTDRFLLEVKVSITINNLLYELPTKLADSKWPKRDDGRIYCESRASFWCIETDFKGPAIPDSGFNSTPHVLKRQSKSSRLDSWKLQMFEKRFGHLLNWLTVFKGASFVKFMVGCLCCLGAGGKGGSQRFVRFFSFTIPFHLFDNLCLCSDNLVVKSASNGGHCCVSLEDRLEIKKKVIAHTSSKRDRVNRSRCFVWFQKKIGTGCPWNAGWPRLLKGEECALKGFFSIIWTDTQERIH